MDTLFRFRKAFSLAELMIVVAILGILAALVVPVVQGQIQRAKEAAAKDNLRILRQAIERYALDHNGIPPGYPNNDTLSNPGNKALTDQLIIKGYISKLPQNPFNNKKTFLLIGNNDLFPTGPSFTELYGWIYQPASKTIKLNTIGTDSAGIPYFNY